LGIQDYGDVQFDCQHLFAFTSSYQTFLAVLCSDAIDSEKYFAVIAREKSKSIEIQIRNLILIEQKESNNNLSRSSNLPN
jgi:hypothetical protein